jgi:hypothetical protein
MDPLNEFYVDIIDRELDDIGQMLYRRYSALLTLDPRTPVPADWPAARLVLTNLWTFVQAQREGDFIFFDVDGTICYFESGPIEGFRVAECSDEQPKTPVRRTSKK